MFCEKKNEEKETNDSALVGLNLSDLAAAMKERERNRDRERERERTIHAHTFRIAHGKPCAVIEEGY